LHDTDRMTNKLASRRALRPLSAQDLGQARGGTDGINILISVTTLKSENANEVEGSGGNKPPKK
jgi:hypothetical protein